MGYTPTNWQDDITPLSASNLNKIEQGIVNLDTNKVSKDLLDSLLDNLLNNLLDSLKTELLPANETIAANDLVSLLDNGTISKPAVTNTINAIKTAEVFSNQTGSLACCQIRDNAILIGYKYSNAYGKVVVLSVAEDGTTTIGTPVTFLNAIVDNIAVCKMDDDKVMLCYRDSTNSNRGTACILTISETDITIGNPTVYSGTSAVSESIVTQIDTDKALVYYNVSNGTACVLSVSGTTVTAGTPVVFRSSSVSYVSLCTISTNKALVAYMDVSNSNYGTACVLSVSGTTITVGTAKVFESAVTVVRHFNIGWKCKIISLANQ